MRRITENVVQDYELRHQQAVRKLAPECTLFLKQDNTFPIETGKIAAYGNGVRYTIKGGTGSGDVNVRHMVNVEEGLLNARFEITTTEWLDQYDLILEKSKENYYEEIKKSAKAQGISPVMMAMGKAMPEPEYDILLKKDCDTAIYVLARISGEGNDRSPEAGDIALTESEKRDILVLNKLYSRFMLVLNTGGLVDLAPVKEVKNILLLGQLGADTGNILADILLGKSYPSGKLAMTWAKMSDYPSTEGFGDKNDTVYHEGIYVGYRYFDTFHQNVQYPFGYGLGYTRFEIRSEKTAVTENYKVEIVASVKNVGKYTGKEVVQVYVSAPSEILERPYQELAAFQKTIELKPGESEKVILTFFLSDLAGYDENSGEYLLEKGKYIFRIGTSSQETECCGSVTLEKTDVVHRQAVETDTKTDERIEKFVKSLSVRQLAEICLGDFSDTGDMGSIIGAASVSLAGGAGETTRRLKNVGLEKALVMADGPAGVRISPTYKMMNGGIKATSSPFSGDMIALLEPEELNAMALANQPTKEEMEAQEYYQYCTAIPIGTDLAQSFNCDLVSTMGNLVAEEMQLFGVNLWLAPAMNIQRNPLCGRNFEYYSEDPLVSGLMGAAMTIGVQRYAHCGVTVKHFACNNQETNRYTSNSVLSERALRDIYLRGFEICIKQAQPYAVMSSYNLINGEHVCNRKDLIDGILRETWGFKGIVMTDWFVTTEIMCDPTSKYPKASAAGCIKAGNDLTMPGMKSDVTDIMEALENEEHPYRLIRRDIEKCAVRVLKMIEKLSE